MAPILILSLLFIGTVLTYQNLLSRVGAGSTLIRLFCVQEVLTAAQRRGARIQRSGGAGYEITLPIQRS